MSDNVKEMKSEKDKILIMLEMLRETAQAERERAFVNKWIAEYTNSLHPIGNNAKVSVTEPKQALIDARRLIKGALKTIDKVV